MISFIFLNCNAQKSASLYYQYNNQSTKSDSLGYISYLKEVPQKLQRKKNEILLLFNYAAFVNDKISINKKEYLFNDYRCGYLQIRILKKSNIKIYSDKKGTINLKLKKGFNFIIINGNFDNGLGIIYSEYYPVLECI